MYSRIWDTATGQCLRTLVHEDNVSVVAIRFVQNGKYLLAWTLDSCVRLWDYIGGRPLKTYQGHVNEKYSICGAYGTYGTDAGLEPFVTSGSEDGNLLFWNAETKELLQKTTAAHDAAIMAVDTHPTKEVIVTCSADGVIKLWANMPSIRGMNGHLPNGINGASEGQIKYESPEGIELDAAISPNEALDVEMNDDTPAYA